MYFFDHYFATNILQAFKQWLPSLSEADLNVVLSTKISATSGLVNIISYDLVSKMAKELQAKKFMAVIAVSVNIVIMFVPLHMLMEIP